MFVRVRDSDDDDDVDDDHKRGKREGSLLESGQMCASSPSPRGNDGKFDLTFFLLSSLPINPMRPIQLMARAAGPNVCSFVCRVEQTEIAEK